MDEINIKLIKQCKHSISYESSGFSSVYKNPVLGEKISKFPQMIQQSLPDYVIIVLFQLLESQWDIPFQENELPISEIRDSKGRLRKGYRILAIDGKYDLSIFKKIWEMSAASGFGLYMVCIKKEDYRNNSDFLMNTFCELPLFNCYWDDYELINYNDRFLGKWQKSALVIVLAFDGDVLIINTTSDLQFVVDKIKDYFA